VIVTTEDSDVQPIRHRFARRLRALLALAALPLVPGAAEAQLVVGCDFDIADHLGSYIWGGVAHLTGRSSASTQIAEFYLINGNSESSDVDQDGYSTTCDFDNLFIPDDLRVNLTNVDDPSLAIPAQNIIITNLPRTLANGATARVNVYVEIPPGTVAGTYLGQFQIRDSVPDTDPTAPTVGPTGDLLNLDILRVEVTVLEDRGITVVDPEEDIPLDSVVIRARAGQTGTGVFRLANAGNTQLNDVRLTASDLRSESAVGLVIPAANVSFSLPTLASVGVGDTVRVTVSVRVPRGFLGGRYRGYITVHAQGVPQQQVPLIVIVTSTRGILFTDNPIRGGSGTVARIAFNGDPGTDYHLAVYDMLGLLVWTDDGSVFPGVGGSAADPTAGADFAVNYIWPLTNGVGEDIAAGMYLVVVESIVNGQRQLAQEKLMVIR
jgi:hypothetical protein